MNDLKRIKEKQTASQLAEQYFIAIRDQSSRDDPSSYGKTQSSYYKQLGMALDELRKELIDEQDLLWDTVSLSDDWFNNYELFTMVNDLLSRLDRYFGPLDSSNKLVASISNSFCACSPVLSGAQDIWWVNKSTNSYHYVWVPEISALLFRTNSDGDNQWLKLNKIAEQVTDLFGVYHRYFLDHGLPGLRIPIDSRLDDASDSLGELLNSTFFLTSDDMDGFSIEVIFPYGKEKSIQSNYKHVHKLVTKVPLVESFAFILDQL